MSVLAHIHPFDLLPEHEQLDLWNNRQEVHLLPGQFLLTQGSPPSEWLYVVLQGKVRYIDSLSCRASADGASGSFCGLQSILTGVTQPCDVVAALPTQCLQLSADRFHQLCRDYPAFHQAFPQEWPPLPEPPDAGGWEGGVEAGPFAFLQQWLGSRSWNTILDAGTGESSLRWILNLPQSRWTAVTGSASWQTALYALFGQYLRPHDRILVDNWQNEQLLADECFDIVLADYLLGAVERYAPYFQEQLWRRLHRHVGQWLLVVGLEPPLLQATNTPGSQLLQQIIRLRDACLLLAGQTCFREYPLSWVKQTLVQSGFQIEAWHTFPNRLGLCYIHTLLDECLKLLPNIPSVPMTEGMAQHIATLRQRACDLPESYWGICMGMDYAVIASPHPTKSSAV